MSMSIHIGANSPWGIIDHVDHVAPGIVRVETPSHGGYWVSRERFESMPLDYQAVSTNKDGTGGAWFEEDCEWSAVALSFPDDFDMGGSPEETRKIAESTYQWLVSYRKEGSCNAG